MKVVILGTAMTSFSMPFDDTWEVWGCGSAWQLTERVDRWFEFHDINALKQTPKLYGPHISWLESQDIPIYVSRPHAELNNAIPYPIEQVKAEFGRYFTNTISLMIAFALLEGVTEIAIMGVNMAWNEEYSEQRPSCEHMIGVAMGKGVTVHIPDTSDLLKCGHIYGFESPPDVVRRLNSKKASLVRDIAIRKQEKETAEKSELLLTGELEAVKYTTRHL